MVRLFSFFSMIKRMLLLSKSMLSNSLCEIWDLILNESIMSLLDSDEFRQLLVVYVRRRYELRMMKFCDRQSQLLIEY